MGNNTIWNIIVTIISTIILVTFIYGMIKDTKQAMKKLREKNENRRIQ